jgi:hypothetical protein
MDAKARALQTLYRMGKITKSGIAEAVKDGVITAIQYTEITGETYGA